MVPAGDGQATHPRTREHALRVRKRGGQTVGELWRYCMVRQRVAFKHALWIIPGFIETGSGKPGNCCTSETEPGASQSVICATDSHTSARRPPA